MSDYLERFLGVGHDPSPTARFDRLASKIQLMQRCDRSIARGRSNGFNRDRQHSIPLVF